MGSLGVCINKYFALAPDAEAKTNGREWRRRQHACCIGCGETRYGSEHKEKDTRLSKPPQARRTGQNTSAVHVERP